MHNSSTAYLAPNWKDYNTLRNSMPMPEYGRNIQRMVMSLLAIKDRNIRTQQAYAVITAMGNLFPHLRYMDDFKHKLWDHLFVIANFQLDIDAPYPAPTAETFTQKPDKVPYFNSKDVECRHYGRYIPNIVWYAAKLPHCEERTQLIKAIATHMKRIYLTWNKDVVSDEIIFKDIETLSGGRINMDDAPRLKVGNYTTPPNERQKRKHTNQKTNASNQNNQQKRKQQ